MKRLNDSFQKVNFCESFEPLSRNHHPNMIQTEHVYAICCRPEVAGEVISGENEKTIEVMVC